MKKKEEEKKKEEKNRGSERERKRPDIIGWNHETIWLQCAWKTEEKMDCKEPMDLLFQWHEKCVKVCVGVCRCV